MATPILYRLRSASIASTAQILLRRACLTVVGFAMTVPAWAEHTLTVAVLAHRDVSDVQQRWQPLERYLGERLDGHRIVVDAMSYDEINERVARRSIDLVLTNPSHYITLRMRNPLSGALATVIPNGDGVALNSFGGAIVVRSDRLDIRRVEDLRGRRIAAVQRDSLGGYQAQLAFLSERGIDLPPARVTFLGMPHDRVVEAVLAGEFDAGFVRSGVVESMAAEGRIEASALHIVGRQDLPGYPHAVSTRLFPEWPLFALPHVDSVTARRIAAALLALDADEPLVRAMDIRGFSIPADYLPIEEMLRSLRLSPFEQAPEVTWRDIRDQHGHWLIALAALTLLLSAALMRILFLSRRAQQLHKHFRRLFRHVPAPILVIENGRITDCNAAIVEALGVADMTEVVGKCPHEISPVRQPDGEDSQAKAERLLRQVPEQGETRFEWAHLKRDGSLLLAEVSLLPIHVRGRPAILGVWHDITERKKAADVVARELELFSGGPVVVIEWSPEPGWPVLSVSGNAAAVLGHAREVLTADTFRFVDLLHPDDVDRVAEEALSYMWSDALVWEQAYRLRKGSGEYAWYYDFTRVTRDEAGNVVRLRGYLVDQTRTKELELALARERQSLYNILWGTGVGTWEWNVQTGETRFNARWAEIVGYALEELAPVSIDTWIRLTHPEDLVRSNAALQRHFEGKAEHYECEARMRHRNGHWVWVLDRGKVVSRTEDGKPEWVAGTHLEITERKRSEEQHRSLIEALSDAGIMLFVVDGQYRVRYANRTFEATFGDQPGTRCFESVGHQDAACAHCELDAVISEQRKVHYEPTTPDGRTYDIVAVPYVDTDGTACKLEVLRDVTEQKAQQRLLEHIAHYDALTGLPNRILLTDRLEQAMLRARRSSARIAVAYIDLDGFKAINDNFGHDIGDRLLEELAQRMRTVLREGDTIARLGGDEFVAVLGDLGSPDDSMPVVQRLLSALSRPVHVEDRTMQVSASIGITYFPQVDPIEADQLLRQADQAMYQAKLSGKNRFHLFDTDLDRSIRGHHESVERIREAWENDEFVMYYQPEINLRTGELIGAEALIRWRHPQRGMILPHEFLPVVEEHRLGIAIGEWVIDTAFRQLKRWHQCGLVIPVSVNVSAHHLQQPDFVERLAVIVARHADVLAGYLEIEVLETVALKDMAHVSAVMEQCAKLGVRFSLDDFGTGYSSLSYLKRFPVHALKIDRSFVHDMLDDPDHLAILEGVLGLAAAFRRHAVAEGVETVEQGEALLRLGCEFGQGFGIARPMSGEALVKWAGQWKPPPKWTTTRRLAHDKRSLMLASVEHRAWIDSVSQCIAIGCDALPPLDERECRFGRWLHGPDGHGTDLSEKMFASIELTHRKVHALAQELIDLGNREGRAEARARLPELHAEKDRLLGLMAELMEP